MLESFTETFRLALAGYLICVAAAACVGAHQPLLSYPWRAAYSCARITLAVLTLGRVRITPLAKRARRSNSRRLRTLRFEVGELRVGISEKLGRRSDKPQGTWSSGDVDA